MRIFLFLLLAFSLPCQEIFAQHRLKGFLGVEGGESFTYIMEFTDSSGFIRGYSYTRQSEKQEVKARIEGLLNRQRRTLRFRETELLYNHGFESRATICLIEAELRFLKEDGEMIFKGPVATSDAAQAACSGGTIIIADTAAVRAVFEAPATPDENKTGRQPAEISPKNKPVKYLYDTTRSMDKPVKPAEKIQQVTEGKEAVFYWHSDSVVLYLWDGGKIDGDGLSVWIGKELLLSHYVLTKERKKLSIPFSGTEMILTVYAENEGNEPPNTANILLQDGEESHSIFSYNVKGKAAKIKIIRK